MSSRSAGGTAYDRREQLDLESAIAASTSLSTQQHSVAPLHRLPSLHGTLDNSSHPNPTGGTATTTTDEIASFGTTSRHNLVPMAQAVGGRLLAGAGAGVGAGKGSIGTPLSEIQSFGEDNSGRGNARHSAQPGGGGGAGEGEDDDFEDVVQDSEGDDNADALGLSPPSAHNNKPAPSGPLDAPDYDWSLPSPSTTTSSLHLPVPPLPLPLALPSKKRESPFSIVVPPAGNNGGPSSKKPPSKKKSSRAKPTSSTTALSKEFIDSDDEDEVVIVPAAKKARVIIHDDEDDEDEVEVGDPETDYDELPIATKPKPKKRPTALPASASESSDPVVGSRRSRSRSLSHSLPPTNSLPPVPAPKPKAAPKQRRQPSTAMSSDGEGIHEIRRHVLEQEMKDEADDDDFGVGPKKKKPKAPSKKKAAAPKEPKEPKPKRVKKPTKKELAEKARLAKILEEEAAAAAATGVQDEDEDTPMPDAEIPVAGPAPARSPSADLQPPAPAPADAAPLPQKSTTNRAPSSTSASASTSTSTSANPAPAPAKKKSKSRAQVIASSPSSSSSSSQAEVAPPLPAAKGKEKEKGKGKGVESRIEAVMAAALADEDALGLKATKAAKKTAAAGDESNDENVAPVRKPSTSTASGSGSGTPVVANFKARLVGSGVPSSSNRSPSLGPSSSTKKGLAGVMEKKSLWGHRAPGMSSKVKVPRLHMNLKPPPPPKPPVPKEKARVKKGHEEYSDEEKPWYETKHPEEWDDDDREKFAKVQKRREKGWDSN